MKDTILFGDCKETLSEFAPQSARTCVTSPPYYGLRDYGTATWIGGDPNCNHRRDSKVKPENCNTGHKNHDEAIGALGVAPDNMILVESVEDIDQTKLHNDKVALLAQTTLAMSEWEPILNKAKSEYQNIELPRKSDLCYATTNRQKALINISNKVDKVLVVGSSTSSNTNALVTTINNLGKEAHRIETLDDLDNISLDNVDVAITAGASAPDHIVKEISEYLNPNNLEFFIDTTEEEYFPLPKELRSNITSLSKLLKNMFPTNSKEAVNGISKDKSWSATEALSSL